MPYKKVFVIFVFSYFAVISNVMAFKKIQLSYGRISLIDLGSFINSDIKIQNTSLINAYKLSAFPDESKKSILAVQAILNEGSSELNLSTEEGLNHFSIEISADEFSENLILNPIKARSQILENVLKLKKSQSLLIKSPYPVNEYVLAGNPDLISLEKIYPRSHPDYLKTFLIYSKNQTGLTDLLIATNRLVYKLCIEITENIEEPIYEFQLPY